MPTDHQRGAGVACAAGRHPEPGAGRGAVSVGPRSGVRGGGFFRVAFFFPQVMSAIVVGVLWSFVFHPTIGVLNGVLGILGIQSLQSFPWLGDPATLYGCILAVTVWQAVGFYMVLFITGMDSIPPHFYEAARLDGATPVDVFFRIGIRARR